MADTTGLRDGLGVSSLVCTADKSATVLSSSQSGACVLLGDEAGRLTAVGWEFDRTASEGGARHGSVRVSKVDLGSVRNERGSRANDQSSPPSSLTYLDAAHVFLSSACGDSAVIRLDLSHEPSSPVSPSVHSSARAIPARRGKGKARQEEEEDWAVVLEDGQVGEIDTLERWMNLAPVKDFCTVEEEGGGVVSWVEEWADISRIWSWRPVRRMQTLYEW